MAQVVYEVNVKGVDERRLVGVQLQKLAEGEAGSASYFFPFSPAICLGRSILSDVYKRFSINPGDPRTTSSGNARTAVSCSSVF